MHVKLRNFCQHAVVDPGFPVGGALTHWGGADLQCIHFLAKTYAKTKEIDPVGGCTLAAPPWIRQWHGYVFSFKVIRMGKFPC